MIDVTDRFAEGFLRAGGRLSLAEWMGLTAEAQEAFAAAGDRIRRGLLAEIVSGLVAGIEDGGAERALDLGIARAAERLTGAA